MGLEMSIEQVDNGWCLRYRGHDLLSKVVVCQNWEDVLKELDDYFGWYDMSGKHSKKHL